MQPKAWRRAMCWLCILGSACSQASPARTRDQREAGAPAAAGAEAGIAGRVARPAPETAGASAGAGAVAPADGGAVTIVPHGADEDGGAAGSSAPAHPLRLAIEVPAAMPGAEDNVCVLLELPNDGELWVASMTATLSGGGHRLIASRVVGRNNDLHATPEPCPIAVGPEPTLLFIAQRARTQLDLPAGTGVRLEPRQRVHLQLHYANELSRAADIEGVLEFQPLEVGAGPEPIEAHALFHPQLAIDVPAGEARLSELFVTLGSASRPRHVFALSVHMHARGVRSTIERVATGTAPDSAPIYESTNWADSPLTLLDPPLVFTGRDGLRLRCRYQNDSPAGVRSGSRLADEMCFMWGHYVEPL